MKRHFPSRITIHHEGTPKPLTPDKDPKLLLRNLQQWGAAEKNWPDLPYHFLVDLQGKIYAGRDPLAVGDTSTSYDPAGHLLVTFMGNYELQDPTDAQLKAACDLIAWACDYYNVDPATIRGHKDYVPTTLCPGKTLYPRVESGWFRDEVCSRLGKAYGGAPGTGIGKPGH